MQGTGQSPRVSVLLAAYQAERDIEGAVCSVLRQSMPDLELVVVDDASTDATAAIVAALAATDSRLRLHRLHANRGPGAARNAGLVLCRGEWVALLDSDDVFAPNRLDVLLDAARTSNADMVADNLTLIHSPARGRNSPALAESDFPADGWIDLHTYLRSNDFTPERYNFGYLKPMVKRRLIVERALRFQEHLRVCEDFHFHLECLLAGARWTVVAQPLYAYALRAGSLSHSLTAETLEPVLAAGLRQMADPRLDSEGRRLLAQRQRNMECTADYLRFRQHLRARALAAALQQAIRTPRLLTMILCRLWRRGIG